MYDQSNVISLYFHRLTNDMPIVWALAYPLSNQRYTVQVDASMLDRLSCGSVPSINVSFLLISLPCNAE